MPLKVKLKDGTLQKYDWLCLIVTSRHEITGEPMQLQVLPASASVDLTEHNDFVLVLASADTFACAMKEMPGRPPGETRDADPTDQPDSGPPGSGS